ncbi:hypothetical protein LUW74_25805 [Actinomadura madurae]|uniref:hypothetical protein n=1 Tax=Actinomadura madurae TaxID=1993 RepID=UPI002025DD71|nr:hypothetical protein [Actinomadura madurae]URN06400.1 hypothetical protein LUW74_25805 [Actinomadura madurae]
MILQHMVTIVRWPGAAALAAGVPLAALVAAAPGTAHAAPAKRTAVAKGAVWAAPLKARDFDLRRGADRSAPLRALAGRLRRTGVGALLGASGSSRLGRGCGKAAAVPSGAQVYCFDRADTATRAWIPQGVTSVSDAVAGERWAGGDRPLVVSWHENGKVRITFVDPARRRYRHVLLVEPVMKGRHVTYRDIKVHAGGIAWYGDRLYVADTWRGLREFDMRQIYDLARSKAGSTGHAGRVGLHRGKYYAHGYRFVMPQTGDRRFVRGARPRVQGVGAAAHVVGGRRPDPVAARPHRGRVLPPGPGAGTRRHLADGGAGGERDRPRHLGATLPGDRIQGGVRTRGHWWFTQGRGTKRGRLLTTRPGRNGWGRVKYRTISHGPEDLSCFRGRHRIWTIAERPNKRALWSFHASPCG